MLDCGRKIISSAGKKKPHCRDAGAPKAGSSAPSPNPKLCVNAIACILLAANAVFRKPVASLRGIEKVGDRSLESTEFSSA
jgi:hypothetical protein